MPTDDMDVVIVGAGISGICAAHYLRERCPGQKFTLLEARDAIGGTWDLFRYPGVRSDSDMFTLGYSFRPWHEEGSFASGPTIRRYVEDTAREEGIAPQIRFAQRVTRASWNSSQARWTLTVTGRDGTSKPLGCRFVFFCSGYYDYAGGHDPEWPGRADFQGRVVHPQRWPEDLDYTGQRVVVIGSGATAVTIVPAMTDRAAHVTMLQRSPSWIAPLPARDRLAAMWRRVLPGRLAYGLTRWKNILAAIVIYRIAQRRPDTFARWLLGWARKMTGPGFDVERHLKAPYPPWDQRLCVVPDGDLFRAVREGRASIVTDTIERFTPGGIRLASGEELPADIVVTATGLKVQMLGGAALEVDGRPVDLSQCVSYRGLMFGGVPNLALTAGYINASWTLRAEIAARYVCRLLRRMERTGEEICWPDPPAAGTVQTRRGLDLSSGYVQRAEGVLPRQGDRSPWRVRQNYLVDLVTMRLARLADGTLRFAKRGEAVAPAKPA